MIEDNDFLNTIDQGYIGYTKPQVKFTPDQYDGTPGWVIAKFTKLAKLEGLLLDEYMDKYNPSLNPADWDNDPSSAEQAWA